MKLHSVLMPVATLNPALQFLRDTLGVPLRFADGTRYAAFDSTLPIALVADEERLVDTPALVVRVDDLATALNALVAAGAELRRAPQTGPHEHRAVVRAAWLDLVLSQPHSTGA